MRYCILVFMLFFYALGYAQLSGEILYEEKINLHARIPEDRAELKDVIPEFRTNQMILQFNGEEAIYKKYVDPNAEPEQEVDMSQRGGRRGFRHRQPDLILWQNYQTFERVEQREFMDKKFLITGEPHQYAWKFESETIDVGSYTARLATYSDSTKSVKAWYVPEIAAPLGPDEYGQLPGLILHVDINDGERTWTATSIQLDVELKEEIVEPTKGKSVTEEEFRAMVKEKMEEMRESRGSNFRMIRPH